MKCGQLNCHGNWSRVHREGMCLMKCNNTIPPTPPPRCPPSLTLSEWLSMFYGWSAQARLPLCLDGFQMFGSLCLGCADCFLGTFEWINKCHHFSAILQELFMSVSVSDKTSFHERIFSSFVLTWYIFFVCLIRGKWQGLLEWIGYQLIIQSSESQTKVQYFKGIEIWMKGKSCKSSLSASCNYNINSKKKGLLLKAPKFENKPMKRDQLLKCYMLKSLSYNMNV